MTAPESCTAASESENKVFNDKVGNLLLRYLPSIARSRETAGRDLMWRITTRKRAREIEREREKGEKGCEVCEGAREHVVSAVADAILADRCYRYSCLYWSVSRRREGGWHGKTRQDKAKRRVRIKRLLEAAVGGMRLGYITRPS